MSRGIKDFNDHAKQRASDYTAGTDVRIPDHANVHPVEGGAFVEAIVWIPNQSESPAPPFKLQPSIDVTNQRAPVHPLNELAERVHTANAKWWTDLHTGKPIVRNFGELIALVHSELSEALEGDRKNLQDDKLPNRPMVEVELADAVIRILDICGGLHYDLGGAFEEKMQFNSKRSDHQVEHRLKDGGKKY